MEYAKRIGDEFDSVAAAINIDGVGPYTGTTTAATFSASSGFDSLVDEAIQKVPSILRVEPWPASDHYIFYSHGVPSIALTSRGIRDIYHSVSDTVDWISAEKLAESVRLVLDLFEELDTKDGAWGRPRK